LQDPKSQLIGKLIAAGKLAGFSIGQMIDLLGAGLTVETLLHLIELRLNPPATSPRSSRWIV
jgi:hypothetical protein